MFQANKTIASTVQRDSIHRYPPKYLLNSRKSAKFNVG